MHLENGIQVRRTVSMKGEQEVACAPPNDDIAGDLG